MGMAKASGLGMLLGVGDTMDCAGCGAVPGGEECVDDALDMIGGDGVESFFLQNGWVLYCLESFS